MDRPPVSDALVFFGMTGDLAHKKIFPALYAMTKRGELTVPVVGVASTPWNTEQLLDHYRRAGLLCEIAADEPVDTITRKILERLSAQA